MANDPNEWRKPRRWARPKKPAHNTGDRQLELKIAVSEVSAADRLKIENRRMSLMRDMLTPRERKVT